MHARSLAVAAATAVLVAAPGAQAHNTSRPSPRAGDGGTVFTVKGRAWQPRGRIRADYYRVSSDKTPFSRTTFRTSRSGRFRFRLFDPFAFETGVTQKLCFVQFDTRFNRRFRSCQRFYVAPPFAYFMPADGAAGQLFVLVANGFQAGRTLLIQLTRPDRVVEQYDMTTRTRGAFVDGGQLGPLFVPRGGAIRLFQSGTGDPRGLYTAFITQPGVPARARAAVLVEPPG
jgi:hypothetical protein